MCMYKYGGICGRIVISFDDNHKNEMAVGVSELWIYRCKCSGGARYVAEANNSES
jgi:hypothetical protein